LEWLYYYVTTVGTLWWLRASGGHFKSHTVALDRLDLETRRLGSWNGYQKRTILELALYASGMIPASTIQLT
jgi:hypothetical protein